VIAQYENPTTIAGAGADFNRYAVILQNLIQQQDLWAQARGQIALGLIDTYRALGGGWQIRCSPEVAGPTLFEDQNGPTPAPEQLQPPQSPVEEIPPIPQSGAPTKSVTPAPPAPGNSSSGGDAFSLPAPALIVPPNGAPPNGAPSP